MFTGQLMPLLIKWKLHSSNNSFICDMFTVYRTRFTTKIRRNIFFQIKNEGAQVSPNKLLIFQNHVAPYMYLCMSSRASASRVSGLRTCLRRLGCRSARMRFHWVTQPAWITLGSPCLMAFIMVSSHLLMACSLSCSIYQTFIIFTSQRFLFCTRRGDP